MKKFLHLHKVPLLFFLSCCAFYFAFAYDLERTDFIKLFSLYTGLFFLSWKFFQFEKGDFRLLFWVSLLFRLIFLFSIPNLSQDFYRFIWDGKMLLEGLNPYLSTPQELFSSGKIPFAGATELFHGMGSLSAGNFSNYPPLNQFLFAIASFVGAKSMLGAVVLMRIMIICGDLGIFYFGRKLLRNLNLPENRIFWYLLNPFIIIELTGNLHFEGVMIFFLLGALFFLQCQKWHLSAVFLACSVSVKLLPLIFLPLLFRRLGMKRAIAYCAVVGIISLLLFLPFFTGEFLRNYLETVALWFQKFELNASLFYIIRWIGYRVEGYNILIYAGPVLAAVVFALVLAMAFLERNRTMKGLLVSMLFSICIYFFLASTVHPWYLATPLFLSIFTRYKFVQVWSLMVVLSYFAYSRPSYEENLWLIALEYVVVFAAMLYEVFSQRAQRFPAELAEKSR